MELLLVRHAIAADARPGQPDSERALTPRGQRRMQRAVTGLLALELRCDRLYHSPWTRAAQTAAVLAPLVGGPSEPTDLLARAPGPVLLALLAESERAADRSDRDARIALVGHQPWMGELLALLVAGDNRFAENLLFGKGGVAWLLGDCRPGGMALRALLPPRVLRALGRP